jgi:hypothetical protein
VALARTGGIALDRETERLAADPDAPGYTVAQLVRAHLAVLVELRREAPRRAHIDELDRVLASMRLDIDGTPAVESAAPPSQR